PPATTTASSRTGRPSAPRSSSTTTATSSARSTTVTPWVVRSPRRCVWCRPPRPASAARWSGSRDRRRWASRRSRSSATGLEAPLASMKVHLQYGKEGLSIDLPSANARVIEPTFVEGLPDEGRSFEDAVRQPLGGRPLRETVKASDRVAVVIPDITRPLPTDRLLRWILAELSHVPAERFTIINGTGSHRGN